DRGRIPDVAQRGDDPDPGLAALGGHGLELLAIGARVQQEVGALGGERERDRATDVATGARDERRSASKAQPVAFHGSSLAGRPLPSMASRPITPAATITHSQPNQ